MAAINDLISQIQDETLRNRIQEEVSKMAKQKKFGLVFEEHMPESTPLYDMPIKRGCNVTRRDSKDDKSIYVVLRVEGDTAVCVKPEQKDEAVTFDLKDIVRVAEFGESIYPYLKPLDSVCNAPDSDLWHTLIEADNYHALQLLEYLYAGKVDCIYIDPPYNTGAKDWKYNNDYVDGNDAYRHSKWLSFMQRRLQLAKKLLNPEDSVLIVTIDEKEYLHLGCLLEEMFPAARMQMITTVISAKGVVRTGQLSRVEEYIFILEWGSSCVCSSIYNMLDNEVKKESDRSIEWLGFRRRAPQAKRNSRPNQFYPIYVNNVDGKIASIGDVVQHGIDRNSIFVPDGCTALWPLSKDGDERLWSLVVIQVCAGSGTKVSDTDLDDVIAKIEERMGDSFKENEVVHTFGSTGTLSIHGLTVPHIEPSEIAEDRRIRVVLFKENLSTGWDCPRAETMMSFRRAEDATYIRLLSGRPLASNRFRMIISLKARERLNLYR